jgi:hypothetical protein
MTTRTYSELLATVEALCGATLATAERNRIKYFVNRRARKAYAESRYWPRFLKVEERICSEDGLLPFTQTGLDTIGAAFRIHATEPYERTTSLEYVDFAPIGSGIQIANYQPRELSTGADMIVTGSLNPDVTGRYRATVTTDYTNGSVSGYTNISNTNYTLDPFVAETGGVISYIQWNLGEPAFTSNENWAGDAGLLLSPLLPSDVTTWEANINGSATGVPVVTEETVYSVWVTYKAALPDTYGDGDTEEADVPEEWFDYLIGAAYSDYLRNDGQNEKATMEEAGANEYLQQQLERLDTTGSFLFGKIINHANTQTR